MITPGQQLIRCENEDCGRVLGYWHETTGEVESLIGPVNRDADGNFRFVCPSCDSETVVDPDSDTERDGAGPNR